MCYLTFRSITQIGKYCIIRYNRILIIKQIIKDYWTSGKHLWGDENWRTKWCQKSCCTPGNQRFDSETYNVLVCKRISSYEEQIWLLCSFPVGNLWHAWKCQPEAKNKLVVTRVTYYCVFTRELGDGMERYILLKLKFMYAAHSWWLLLSTSRIHSSSM